MIGRTILEFRIERRLAQGGMGAVYLARHVLLPSTLKVVKVLLPEYATNEVLRQRFHREAEAVSLLKHESILGNDNFGMLEDGQLFLMVPYLEGQSLDAYLRAREGRLAPHRALHLIVQLCDALDHAHRLGIVHRDLKPGNVFVVATHANPYALKLLDFGIAKILEGEAAGPRTHSGVAIGTPGYMAVEQYEHADEVTHLADVYSMAIMIWEIVTGRLPWHHPDHAVLYHQQRTVIPARPAADVMPPVWAEILLAALSVDPAARPQSVRELAVTLASALPAVGRVPSGAEILAGLAPHFVRHAAPGDETVRNASEVDRIGPLLWPQRETAPGAPQELPDSSRELPGTPTVQRTTLSAATGVASRRGERRAPRWRLALVAASTTALTAVATGGIAASLWSGDSSAVAPASSLEVPASSLEVPASPSDPAVAIEASRSAATGRDAEPPPSPDPGEARKGDGQAARFDGSRAAHTLEGSAPPAPFAFAVSTCAHSWAGGHHSAGPSPEPRAWPGRKARGSRW